MEKQRQESMCLIATFVSEETSCHILSVTNSHGALMKLKYLYDSHSELEII